MQMPCDGLQCIGSPHVALQLIYHMDSLDAQHEARVRGQLLKFYFDDALEPGNIEEALAEVYDRIGGLFANHKDRINHH